MTELPGKKLRYKFVSNDTFMEATCSRFRTSCCLHKGDMLNHVCDIHQERYAK